MTILMNILSGLGLISLGVCLLAMVAGYKILRPITGRLFTVVALILTLNEVFKLLKALKNS